ncbi:hypothetical protein GVv1_48640 (plasmid) [Enterobacter pseudoroggenkampii]
MMITDYRIVWFLLNCGGCDQVRTIRWVMQLGFRVGPWSQFLPEPADSDPLRTTGLVMTLWCTVGPWSQFPPEPAGSDPLRTTGLVVTLWCTVGPWSQFLWSVPSAIRQENRVGNGTLVYGRTVSLSVL